MHHPLPPNLALDLDNPSIVVVVGAELMAEAFDRPVAHDLANRVNQLLAAEAAAAGGGVTLAAAVVCTDLWYLNNNHLRLAPSIAVGAPEVNAFSAFLIGRVPVVFAVEGRYAVHADAAMDQLLACAWGVDGPNTAAAVDALAERHLRAFVAAAAGQTHGA